MFGGKKASRSPGGGGGAKPKNNDLANMMGLGAPMDADDDEDSLLAELAALEGRPAGKKKAKPQQKLVSMDEIQRMAAAGMKDIDDDDDGDDDDDFDESDLLAELNELASDEDDTEMEVDSGQQARQPASKPSSNIKSILLERKEMYKQAIDTAKAENASSKVRRLERGLKEIDNLIKKADKSGNVNEDEIPPPVATKTSKPINPQTQTLPGPSADTNPTPEVPVERFTAPTQPPPLKPTAPPEPVSKTNPNNEKLSLLYERQKQFKVLALKLKQQGDMEGARKNLAISKQFDSVIAVAQEGKGIDLSNMPQLPSATSSPQQSPKPKPNPVPVQVEAPSASAASSAPPPAPSNIMEALQQRLAKYQEATDNAKEEGNSSKSRRMGRIVKQYQDAIKANKLNKPYEYSELPTPPGFGPIPGIAAAPPVDQTALMNDISETSNVTTPQRPVAGAAASSMGSSTQPISATRNEKEYEFLVTRQKEFKMAALEAKKTGDVESAREYLRQAKGMDQMILAAQNGMRVDVTTVPSLKKKDASMNSPNAIGTQPGAKESVELSGNKEQQFMQIEAALRKQIETAEKNSEHYKLLGNLDAGKNFESLLTSSKKDLNTLLQFKKQKGPVPKCNYLTKTFPVVKSNPHLSDSELEITIARCINVPLPSGYQAKDMYCYVTYDFPYPQDRPQTGTTTTKKETINPEYNESFKVTIDRKQSSFKRFCRRQAVNVKVHHVRGFLKSDKPLGQASIKVGAFSNKCEIHECVDLVDVEKGRKAVGGKIEVLLKIREPFEDKDTEVVKEKWLVLDTHLRSLDLKTPSSQAAARPPASAYESLEVLKSEKSLFERQIATYKAQGKQPPANLFDKSTSHQKKMENIQTRLKQGGKQVFVDYLSNLSRGLDVEKSNAQKAMQHDDKQTAKNCLTKRKLIEKEIGVIKQRLGL